MVKRRKKPASKLAKSKKELAQKNDTKHGVRVKNKKTAKKIKLESETKTVVSEYKAQAEEKRVLSQEEVIVMAAKVEREKRLIMWSGVTFFMVLIAFFWLYNTKQVLEDSRLNGEEASISFSDWESVSEELSSKIAEIKDSVKEVNSSSTTIQALEEVIGTTSDEAVLPGSTEDSPDEIDALKERLEALENKLKNDQ